MNPEARPPRSETLLDRICRPRPPGSADVGAAEDLVEERLTELGLHVERQEFSTTARRLYAASLGAAGVGWAALLVSPLYVLPVPPWSVVAVVIAAFAAVALIAAGIADGRLPFDTPAVSATNLIATRGGGPVRAWLVAHLDTKTQPLSLRGRILASVAVVVGVVLLVGALAVRVVTPLPWFLVAPLVLLVVAGAAALSRGPLTEGSPGAVDNGSGIVAVLAAAEALRHRKDVGVLLTGAEEYGMEGARAWVGAGGRGEWFVNFDGIDDRGAFNLMAHGAGGPLRERLARGLVDRGEPVRAAPLPLGVFVDGSVLARGGMAGVTVSRGDGETLAVVHTPRDGAGRLTGAAALLAGTVSASVLEQMLS